MMASPWIAEFVPAFALHYLAENARAEFPVWRESPIATGVRAPGILIESARRSISLFLRIGLSENRAHSISSAIGMPVIAAAEPLTKLVWKNRRKEDIFDCPLGW
jgi:hypothetical protein